MIKTIHSVRVYESLKFKDHGNSRLIAWSETEDGARIALQQFGAECRWSYAVIEEIAAGAHEICSKQIWLEHQSETNTWSDFDKGDYAEENSLLHCFNHCIG